jgi:hypothetical protein
VRELDIVLVGHLARVRRGQRGHPMVLADPGRQLDGAGT